MKITLEIDDSYFSSSELDIEVAEEVQKIEFKPRLQHGYGDVFYIYPDDIDKLIEFLQDAKVKLGD